MGGADVKNYIRPYYRTGAALGQSAAVLPHQRGGTTVRGADVKNYIRPYYRTGAAQGQGAAVLPLQKGGTTMTPSGTTACACGTTASTAVVVRFLYNQDNKGKLHSAGKGGTSVRVDSTQTFLTRTPS